MMDEALTSRSRVFYALAGLAALLLAAVVVITGAAPSSEGTVRYTATFRRAGQGLDPGRSDVKVRGIVVGRVESVDLNAAGAVTVTFRVERAVAVSGEASAAIEPVSIFGPEDLALDPGSGPRLPEGGTITRTTEPQELSDTARSAYDLVRAIDPDDVATLLHALGHGFAGQGPALRRTVGNAASVVDMAHANRAVIAALLDDIAGVGGALGGRGDAVTAAIGDFNAVAPEFHERPDKVARLLDTAAGLSDRVGGMLERQGAHLGGLADGAGQAAEVMARYEKNISTLLNVLEGFFNGLQKILRVPGPEWSILAQGKAEMPINPCQIFIDICPRGLR